MDTNMASNPWRSGESGLVQSRLRSEPRAILYPLKFKKCEMNGPEVNAYNFVSNSSILCNRYVGPNREAGLTPRKSGVVSNRFSPEQVRLEICKEIHCVASLVH